VAQSQPEDSLDAQSCRQVGDRSPVIHRHHRDCSAEILAGVPLEPVLYGVDDYVQGERGAVEHTGLDVADCDGLGARAERLPQDFVGGGQHGQVAMQVNDVVRTGEPDLHLHALLEGVKPTHYLEKAERLEHGPGAVEFAGGNEKVGVDVTAATGRIQPPGDRGPLSKMLGIPAS
jgi:hypothetical protein